VAYAPVSKAEQTNNDMMHVEKLIRDLPLKARILDVGCFGFGLFQMSERCGRIDIENYGVDYSQPDNIPLGYRFSQIDLNHALLPFPDDTFDFILASHVIEHLRDGVAFYLECARILKPGGQFLVTCPSERSLLRNGFPFSYEKFCSTSFFDDPTHLGRPYSPQSLFRLASYCSLKPMECGYEQSLLIKCLLPILVPYAWISRDAVLLERVIWRGTGWASFLLAMKPSKATGKLEFRYYIPYRSSPLLSKWMWIKRRFK